VGQTDVWRAQQLMPGGTVYNIGGYASMFCAVDHFALERAIRRELERTETHHFRFMETDDGPRQYFAKSTHFNLTAVDMSGHGDPQAAAIAWMRDFMDTPFDLADGPLFRYALIKVADEHMIGFGAWHHLIADAFAARLFMRRIVDSYRADLDGTAFENERCTTWNEFLCDEAEYARSARHDRDRIYWRELLEGYPGAATLSGKAPTWPDRAIESCGRIPRGLVVELEKLGARHDCTPAAVILAVTTAYLSRITGARDIVIGMPVAGRPSLKLCQVVGFLSNVVPVRLVVSESESFASLLRLAGARVREAFRHQRYWGGAIRRDLGIAANQPNIYGTILNFLPSNAAREIAGRPVVMHPFVNTRLAEDLMINVNARSDADMEVQFCGHASNYDSLSLERIVGQYLTLLAAAIAAPEKPIGVLPLLPEDQLAMLRRWNDTAVSWPRMPSLVAQFEATAAESPDAPAISVGEARWSYAELNAHVNRLAAVLCTLNVDRGALVAVCIPRSPLLLIGLLAIQKCGAAYLPLDPEFPAQRLSYMLADSGAHLLLTSGGLPGGMRSPEGVQVLDADAALNRGPIASADPVSVAANRGRYPQPCDPAYVIYTSGSSGRPKGVVVSHGALLNFLHSMRVRPGLTAQDVLAAVTTIAFDIAALELYLPLMVGARIELVPRQTAADGAALAQLLERSGATILQATPATWRMLLETGWSGGDGFRALCGGEALSRPLADSLLKCVGQLWNLYGPTETTVWSTVDRIESGTHAISIGRPIANTQVHILDPAGERVPVGVVGAICIGGDGLADGYHRRPALTAERFLPDCRAAAAGRRLYVTGDLGRWGADGKLYHVGRGDTQVKIRGFRIELAEIERVLEEQAEVRQAVVVVRDAQTGDPRLIAYATYRPGQDLTPGEVRERLRRRLPEFMVPSIVIPLLSMPVTPNGKADRAALPDPFRNSLQAVPSREPPATATEKIVADTWKSVLKVDNVGVGDNFFDLGGYSLLSLRVVKLIEERTGRQIDPRVLFFKDLRQVAALLETEPASRASSEA
jgi:amino acid adenylation domain-containing protein